jgi:integrase
MGVAGLSEQRVALTTSAMGQKLAELVKGSGSLVQQEITAHTLRDTFAQATYLYILEMW